MMFDSVLVKVSCSEELLYLHTISRRHKSPYRFAILRDTLEQLEREPGRQVIVADCGCYAALRLTRALDGEMLEIRFSWLQSAGADSLRGYEERVRLPYRRFHECVEAGTDMAGWNWSQLSVPEKVTRRFEFHSRRNLHQIAQRPLLRHKLGKTLEHHFQWRGAEKILIYDDGAPYSFTDVVERTARANARPMGAYYAFFGAQLLFLLPAALLLIPTADSYLDFLPVILLFFLVGGGLKEPLENMMQMVILSSRILEGVRRMDNILRQPEPDQKGSGNPTAFDVEFSNVEFAYTKGIPAVDHVSFRLPQGTVTGLVGPSGGGKSTLAQLLLRFYEPQAGSIRIGGVNIRDIPPDRLADLVAYVFQDSVLFTDTIENNIRMGNTVATMAEVEQAAKNAGIHEVIQALPKGYQTVVGRDNAYLSGGEKQRLAIARVFLKDAPIVILDEATAYADAENEAKIQAAFAKLARNKTVLMIAHRLKTVERADQLLVMERGRLVGAGTHEKLLDSCTTYQKLVEANQRRDRWSIGKGVVRA